MSIAVDQTRLRRIVDEVLAGAPLDRTQVMTILEIGQLAAGITPNDAAEHAALQAVAQQVSAIAGIETGELLPIAPLPDEEARVSWLASLAEQLTSEGARELAFVVAFLVSVANLWLSKPEVTALDEFQRALGLDEKRATDLIIFTSESVASENTGHERLPSATHL
jgi:hypothetical protein